MNYIISRGLPASGKSAMIEILSQMKKELGTVNIYSTDDVRDYVKFIKDVPKDPKDQFRADEAFNKKKALVYDLILEIATKRKMPADEIIIDHILKDKPMMLGDREKLRMGFYAKEALEKRPRTIIFDATFINFRDLKRFYEATEPYHIIIDITAPIDLIYERVKKREESNDPKNKSKAGSDVIEKMLLGYEPLASLPEEMQFKRTIAIENNTDLSELEMKVKAAVREAKEKGWLY